MNNLSWAKSYRRTSRLLPRQITDSYRELSFAGQLKGGGYLYGTGAEWQRLADAMLPTAYEALRAAGVRQPLLGAEYEHLRKGQVNWRAVGFGACQPTGPLVVRSADQGRALAPWLEALGREYAAAILALPVAELRAMYEGADVPIDRGKGAPYFISGTNRLAPVALAALVRDDDLLADLVDRIWSAGSGVVPPCAVIYVRIQGSWKLSSAWRLNSAGLEEAGLQYLPKIRQIQAMPWVLNYVLAPIEAVMSAVRKRLYPQTDGTLDHLQANWGRYKSRVISDLSKFDQTVAAETLEAWRELVLAPVLEALLQRGLLGRKRARLARQILELYASSPMLYPPRFFDDEAMMVPSDGAVKSGERMTSVIDTDVNMCRVRARMAELRQRPDSWTWSNLSDDLVILANGVDEHLWMQGDAHGFEERVATEPSFLMRHLPEGYTYVGRMVTSTLNKELRFEPAGPIQMAAGLAARRVLLRGHPGAHAFDAAITAGSRLSDRLAEADRLSKAGLEPLAHSLGFIAAHTNASGDDFADFIEYMQLRRRASTSEATALESLAGELRKRSRMTFAELQARGRAQGETLAINQIKTWSYRTRSRRT